MNKIKETSICCMYCGKTYKTRTRLDKHLLLCELLNRSKNVIEETEEQEIPSQRKMFYMLSELAFKYNKMEQKVEELNKLLVKKKKNMNVLEWLHCNVIPNITFDNLHENIHIYDLDIEYLFNNTLINTINEIFLKIINTNTITILPIYACTQKNNIIYIFDNEHTWKEASRDKLIKFLNKIQMKITKKMLEWKTTNNKNMKENDVLSTKYDKAMVKIMDIDFNIDAIFNKSLSMIFSIFKTSLEL
jgi:hypothetical protein